jgi:hypothetical protein
MIARSTPRRSARRLAWLGVVGLAAAALFLPTGAAVAASFNGAIWTSLSDGTTVNANIYDNKSDVYLNGGPQNCGNGNGLPNGLYYFQVTDPSGATLLSSDAIKFRMVTVANGVITGTGGTGNHNVGSDSCNSGKPVQLMPYDDTPNNGGEYSVDLAPQAEVVACAGFNSNSTSFNFLDCASSKNDNFKVAVAATPTPPPTPTPTPPPTPTPTPVPPTPTPPPGATPTPTPVATPTPTGGVGGATGTPAATKTLPPTSTIDSAASGPTGDGWRLVLLAMAGVLATALLLTPAGAVVRKDDDSRRA